MYQKKLKKDIRCPLEYGLSVFQRAVEIPHHLNDKCRTPILISECGIDIRLNSPLMESTFLIF